MATLAIGPDTTMEEILRAYPAAKVGLFQRYHIGGCQNCAYQPHDTLEQVRKNFGIADEAAAIAEVIRHSAEVQATLHIGVKELAAALKIGEKVRILDARTSDEYRDWHLPGAERVTVELTFEALDAWAKDTPLVFYSNHGRRSLDRASYFKAYGFPSARSLDGGLEAWKKEMGTSSHRLPIRGL